MREKPGELSRGLEELFDVGVFDVEARAACYVLAELVQRMYRAYTPRKQK